MRSIDPQTLAAVSGQQTLDNATNFAKMIAQRKEAMRLQELQNAKMAQMQLQNQQTEYQMKKQAGEDVLRQRALEVDPPSYDSTPEDWAKYAKMQEAGGFGKSAKSAYDIAESLASGVEVPKSAPELIKLQAVQKRALAKGDTKSAIEIQDRIDKLKDKATPKEAKPKLESANQTAITIASLAKLNGVEVPPETARALGDLSRGMTQRLSDKFDVTQDEVNNQIAIAYQQIIQQRSEAMGWADYIPFNDPQEPTPAEVEMQVMRNIMGQAQQGQVPPAQETPTVDPNKKDELLSKY